MRISDWSSDVCSSDLDGHVSDEPFRQGTQRENGEVGQCGDHDRDDGQQPDELRTVRRQRATGVRELLLGRQRAGQREDEHDRHEAAEERSEEHTSELQSLMRISYAVFCLKKKKTQINKTYRQSSVSKETNHHRAKKK